MTECDEQLLVNNLTHVLSEFYQVKEMSHHDFSLKFCAVLSLQIDFFK